MGQETKTRRIGIMGGTFDPIHYGHLVLAETVRDTMGLEQIVFVPAGSPPHKTDAEITPARHRIAMVQRAIRGNPHFVLSTMETERPGTSFTVDTLEQLRGAVPPGTEFYFITGSDALLGILSWKDAGRMADLCHFVAATRPGTSRGHLREFLDTLPDSLRDRIDVIPVPALEISSTEIRRKTREARTIRYLLPESVEDYIRKEGLYRAP